MGAASWFKPLHGRQEGLVIFDSEGVVVLVEEE